MATKGDVAETDARELVNEDSDRWTVNGGKLGELITSASFDHIRAVFQQYEKVNLTNSYLVLIYFCFKIPFLTLRTITIKSLCHLL